MKAFFQNLRNLFPRRHEEDGYYYDWDGLYDEKFRKNDLPQLYTALDIGTAYAKAIIIEVQGDQGIVMGVGRHQQSYAHMSKSIITNISGVIANCNEALKKAERSAGGMVAPSAIIGIKGELVKGSSITINKQRQEPNKVITPEELDELVTSALKKLLKSAKDHITSETGYQDIEVRLTNAAIISVRIDGQIVDDPIGFRGRHFTLTFFGAFAPLMQFDALERVAQGLDLTLVTIVAEPCALAYCLSTNARADGGAIFVDIGGGTTDIALAKQGGVEEMRSFALGGRTFTHRIATTKGISIREAEKLKLLYSSGFIKGSDREEIQAILAPECQTWMDTVELLIEELSKGEVLPPEIYLVGGGSALSDLYQKLESFPWTERLPFARQPIIQTVQPEMVESIVDPGEMLKSAKDVPLIALAYQAIGLQNENIGPKRAIYRVINNNSIWISDNNDTISNEPQSPHPLRVFLCHSSNDKPNVRALYDQLQNEGFDPWLDEKNLLPGQDWQAEISKAVRASDIVIVCLSRGAVQKTGYIQKEIKFALDVADMQPEGSIFLIPLKLEECDIPERLSRWQWVNLFEEAGYERLVLALQARARKALDL